MSTTAPEQEDLRDRLEVLEAALDAALLELDSERAGREAMAERLARLTAAPARPAGPRQGGPQWAAAPAAAPAGAPAPPAGPAAARPEVVAWVGTWLAHHLERQVGARHRWCTRWQEHPEAVIVLTAMHEEHQRAAADPRLGLGQWIRNSLYVLGDRLLAGSGPFAGCSPDHHEPAAVLPVVWRDAGDPPQGWAGR